MKEKYPQKITWYSQAIEEQIELNIKYEGYIKRQLSEINKLDHLEKLFFPKDINFSSILGLRNEAIEKLKKYNPENLGQASRIAGVSPADLSVLMVALN